MDDTEKHDTIAKSLTGSPHAIPTHHAPWSPGWSQKNTNHWMKAESGTYIPTLVEHGAKNKLNREFSVRAPEI